MAEAVVLPVAVAVGQVIASSLLDPLMQKALDVVKEEKDLATGLKDEISYLNLKLGLIRGVVEDAEAKQLKNASVKGWLVELKEIMYDAEDLLDEYATDVALEAVEADADHRSTVNKAKVSGIMSCCCFTCYGRPNADDSGYHRRVAVAREIKAINARLDKIVHDARNVHDLQELASCSVTRSTFWQSPETTSILDIDESGVLGRYDEIDRIIKWLLADNVAGESESNMKLFVLPIVGMGGIGKTTLARFVYHREKVKTHFEVRVWVCVSNTDFDVKRLTREIIESIYASEGRNEACNHTTMEALQSILVKLIEGKRFLLVLDDAWSDNQIMWVDLLKPLRVGGIGSKVIVTTRNKSVADAIIGRMEPVCLTGLAREDLWKIFKTYAFGNRDSRDHAHLERIGEQIVERLKGSPLAAKTIGRLLNNDLNVKHWRKILESEFWTLEQDKHEIIPSLMLSYQCLPPNLKQCFTYLSLFPEDYRFRKDMIVRLWVAHDFIQNKNEMILEEKGGKCLDYLLNMSLLQQDEFGQQHFSMHDLIHDLSESTSKDEYLRIDDGKIKNLPKSRIRHISYFRNSLSQPIILEDIGKYDKLRSLMIQNYYFRGQTFDISGVLHNWFERLRCLRVLTLRHCRIKSLPDSIGNMKHLRFLDIMGTDIEMLPNSLCCLHNLQYLDASFCNRLHELPNNITRLVNLRYLQNTLDLISQISGIGKLTALQELSRFRVENRNGHRIGELKHLNMLCGSLEIMNLENVESRIEAEEALIDQKEFLQKLTLAWRRTGMDGARGVLAGVQPNVMEIEANVLEGLRPSAYLKELFIKNYNGAKLAAWLNNDSLPDLETIELSGCPELKSIPSLPHLRRLKVIDCPKLSEVAPLSPLLQDFAVTNVGLTSLPEFISGTPSLSHVSIRRCPKLNESLGMHLQHLTSLKTLEINDYPYALDFGDFATLNSLVVEKCPNVTLAASEPCTTLIKLTSTDSPALLRSCHSRAAFILSALTEFDIKNDPLDDMTLSPCLGNATSLKKLTLWDCPNIKDLSKELLRHLTTLEELHICKCEGLTSLDFQVIPSLKSMHIEICPSLAFSHSSPSSYAPLRTVRIIDCSLQQITGILARSHPTSLKSLDIWYCDELVCFDGELELAFLGLTSLQYLLISSCRNLKALPSDLRGFTSFISLFIADCPQMQSLPEMGLPASIDELKIFDCPKLAERYKKEEGNPRWQQISHIPVVRIV